MRKTFKNICANTKLTQAWIFKYDSRIKSSGINIHAGIVAVVHIVFHHIRVIDWSIAAGV